MKISIGKTLDKAFKILIRHFPIFFLIGLVGSSTHLFEQAVEFWPDTFINVFGENYGVSIFLISTLASMFLVTMEAVCIKLASASYQQQEVKFGEAFSQVVSRFWKFLGIKILVYISMFVGFLCLIVPGVIVMLNTLLLYPIYVLEGNSMDESWNRSKSFVKGNRFRIIIMLAIIGIVTGSSFLLPMAGFMLGAPFVSLIVFYLISASVYAMGSIALTVLYHDIRDQREGITLEEAAVRLDVPQNA